MSFEKQTASPAQLQAALAPSGVIERPIEASLSRGEASKELHDVFSPLAKLVASEVMECDTVELFQDVDTLPLVVLDNQMTRCHMPWDVFIGIDELDIVHFNDFTRNHPNSESMSRLELHSAYSSNYREPFLNKIIENYHRLHPDMPPYRTYSARAEFSLDDVRGRIDRTLFDKKASFDFERWKTNEGALAQLSESEQDEYEKYTANRWSNVYKWQRVKSDPGFVQADNIVYAHDPELSPDGANVLNHPVVAVGEYGEEFAKELVSVALAMNRKAEEVLSPIAEAATEQKADLLTMYTARANEEGASSKTTKDTVNEGILSIMQVLAVLTSEKVEGYDDPHELVRALVSSGLVERFARYSPMGMVGPMALGGYHLPGSLEQDEDGLAFSEKLSAYLKKERDAYFGLIATIRADAEEQLRGQKGKGQIYLGTTCPVAGKGDGIRRLSEAFVNSLDKKAS